MKTYYQLDVSNLPNGLYFINLNYNKKIYTLRFAKEA
jgi:hypothetical protein